MSRPAQARIRLDHIIANYQLACSLHPAGQALAVVKADAYGHGAVPVAQALAPYAPAFAVACIEEALELRAAGIIQPVLLLEGFFRNDELPVIAEQNFWTAVHRYDQIQALAATRVAEPLHIWLKVDTGMHRLGFALDEVADVSRQLLALPQVGQVTLMTHFANADTRVTPGIDVQTQLTGLTEVAQALGLDMSVANSAALMVHPMAHKQWQRPGIILYGASPLDFDNQTALQLQPAMSLVTEVIATRWVQNGDSVGYGSRFVATKPTRIGTIAMGYADGYPRQAEEGTPVIVNGQRTRLLGRVSMDMMTVDLTDVDGAAVGNAVELWGSQLDANEVAAHCDTISYHLFTGVTRRVPRIYLTS
ncbi:alanine racemase [Oceanobacter sp. 5_MG-2023]|uniref:alanine racemase n=1 Tax=Oceanobacter sp. 5_MG-2023 TaxID=3062645 RepID=UPI0026E35745|nr:alanine racemase [Oceanobacter sp. 5_MG-2023]MDO6682704.1 alanine racemase [Oceanobacter sp. 5_MG-2023]